MPSFSQAKSSELPTVTPSTLKKTLATDTMSTQSSTYQTQGFRAAEAFVRPTPVATHGNVLAFGFDLQNCVFTIVLTAPSATAEGAPTAIFLPEFHFPADKTAIEASGGKWTITTDERNEVPQQILQWWHAEGEQKLTAKGVQRKPGAVQGTEDDASYVEQYRQQTCVVL